MKTGIGSYETGIGALFSTLAGGGKYNRYMAQQDEEKALADVAYTAAKQRTEEQQQRKFAEETAMLQGRNEAFGGLGGAVTGMLPGVNVDPEVAAYMATVMRAGEGNAEQLAGGFQTMVNMFQQQNALDETDPARQATILAATGRTLPATYYPANTRGITTNRYTGETSFNPNLPRDILAGAGVGAGRSGRIPTTDLRLLFQGEMSDEVDIRSMQEFLQWAYANGRNPDWKSVQEWEKSRARTTPLPDEGGSSWYNPLTWLGGGEAQAAPQPDAGVAQSATPTVQGTVDDYLADAAEAYYDLGWSLPEIYAKLRSVGVDPRLFNQKFGIVPASSAQ